MDFKKLWYDLKILNNNKKYGENTRKRNLIVHSGELFIGSPLTIKNNIFSIATAQNYVTPDPRYVLGADDSHWGGILDLNLTYDRGMRFFIFKATDGTVNTKYWDTNYPNAISKKLVASSYHWLYRDVNVPCKSQALAFWNRIKTQPIQIPPVVDWEWTYWAGQPAYPNLTDLDKFVTEFTRLSGIKPLLYTAAGYANQFGTMPTALKNKFSGLWVANYGVSNPTLPLGWDRWHFWQFTSKLEQDYYAPSSVGKKELDGNYWYGTEGQLYQFAGTTPVDPPVDPPPQVDITSTGTALLGLNVRSGAGTEFPVIDSLGVNDKVYGNIVPDTRWFHFGKIERAGGAVENVEGYCAILSTDTLSLYLYVKDINPTPSITSTPYKPVIVHEIRYDNATETWITIVDMNEPNVSAKVYYNQNKAMGSIVENEISSQIITNCDGWTPKTTIPCDSFGISITNGVLSPRITAPAELGLPYLDISSSNKVSIGVSDNKLGTKYNTFCGFRHILKDGIIPDYLYGTESQYTTRHPRKAFGVIYASNKLVIIKSNGRTPQDMGLTLLDTAKILQSFGVDEAFDADCGGSSFVRINGQQQGTYSDGSERAVVNMLSIQIAEDNGGGNTMGELKLTTSEAGKSRNVRKDASIAHIYGATFASIPSTGYAKAFDDDFFKYTNDVISNGQKVAQAGDIWYKVRTVNGQALPDTAPQDARGKYGWSAGIHLGVKQLNVEAITPPPPPSNFPTRIWLAIEEGGELRAYDLVV